MPQTRKDVLNVSSPFLGVLNPVRGERWQLLRFSELHESGHDPVIVLQEVPLKLDIHVPCAESAHQTFDRQLRCCPVAARDCLEKRPFLITR
jgi:hypothetical protein